MLRLEGGARRLLIVGDQEADSGALAEILHGGGYTTTLGSPVGLDLVAIASEFRPDLILLDLAACGPDDGGVLGFLAPWLADQPYLPILALIAQGDSESKRHALAAGVHDLLMRPLDPIDVLLRVRRLLETRSLYLEVGRPAHERIEEQAALLDRANDAIYVRDAQDRITYWNAGAERLYGWSRAEVEGQGGDDLLGCAPSKVIEEAHWTSLRTGRWSGELRDRTKSGEEIIVASRWSVVRDGRGRPRSTLILNTDITEKKCLESQLLHAQRMEGIGILAGGVAHDFNNLLTVIIGDSEELLSATDLSEDARSLIGGVLKAGQQAASLTRQLLLFSRKQMNQVSVLDLNVLVTDITRMLGRLIGEDVSVAISLDPGLRRVRVDPGLIEQVLINLAINARDAMPTGGVITIATQNVDAEVRSEGTPRPTSFVVLTVTDAGSGMSEEVKSRIFEPFFTTKEVGRGTGLGLSTVLGIVREAGGRVEVTSQVGEGTTFRVFLPAWACGAEDVEASDRSSPRGAETVLVAEDEDAVRSIACRALASLGYTVLAARDGEEALGVTRQYAGPIHLLATDLVMPKMSGRQLAEHVTRLRPGVRVLYLSGHSAEAVLRHGLREGEEVLVRKPYAAVTLARKVREVLDR